MAVALRVVPGWMRRYRRELLAGDSVAGLVVAMLLVPQGMAYATLAGLPPHLGLYACVLPLVVYALLGSSAVLSVGPVAVVALMTASALEAVASPGTPEYVSAAALLALLSGLVLVVFGLLRLGALAHLLSHPVISGFVSGAALLILIGQLRPLLGLDVPSDAGLTMLRDIIAGLPRIHWLTAAVGLATLLLLWVARGWLPRLLGLLGLPAHAARLVSRLAPMVAVLAAIIVVPAAGLDGEGVRVVGELPRGLPPLDFPVIDATLAGALLLPAAMIGLVGFIESVAIGGSLGRLRGERVDPDTELRGLGMANVASAVSSAFPIAGGFSRTAVNADAGANTPLAGVVTAFVIALILASATGLFANLPHAVLAAIIILAVAPLMDLERLRTTWRYDRADAVALAGTTAGVVVFGVEAGVGIGVGLSLASLVWRSSRPHMAVVGQVPGSEHFRNVLRHRVRTRQGLLLLRIDENLYFGNAEAVANRVQRELAAHPGTTHLVLVMSSVSHIDATALEVLDALHDALFIQGVSLHLSEVKGPVLDRLEGTALLPKLSGRVFLSAWDAYRALPTPLANPVAM